jgi:hypothetical protein
MKNWIRKQFRKKARVYIMPTKMGGYLNGLIFLMFLLAIGYNNNLLLIFTLFLFSFNLMWLIQTHFHLYRLKKDHVVFSSGHAGELLEAKIFWKSLPLGPWDWTIELECDQGDFPLIGSIHEEAKSFGEIRPLRRGVLLWNHLKIKTTNPFGLYQTWIYYPLTETTFVYPALLTNAGIFFTGNDLEGEVAIDKSGNDDFRGLGAMGNADSRKVSWKHYARTGELLIKEGEELRSPSLDIELQIPQDAALKERYLSEIATQMVECHKRSIPFSFKSVGFSQACGSGYTHLHECLRELAQC